MSRVPHQLPGHYCVHSASLPLTSVSGRDSPEKGKNKCLLNNSKVLLLFYKLLSVFYQVHYLSTSHLDDEALH